MREKDHKRITTLTDPISPVLRDWMIRLAIRARIVHPLTKKQKRMGYFPPGSSLGIYFEQYCDHCIHLGDPEHPEDCAVLDAHLYYGNAEIPGNEPSPILDMLIPRDARGNNLQCRLFVPRPQPSAPSPEHPAESTPSAEPTTRPVSDGTEGGPNPDV